MLAVIGPHQPGLQLGIEIRRRGKDPTRQERPLQVVVETFDQPLGFGITGLQIHTLAARVPRKAWHAAVSSGWRAHHRPTAPSPSHTNTLGTAPNVERCCHHPAYKSSAVRVGINSAEAHREYPHTMVSTGNAVAGADLAVPHRHNDIGEPEVALPDLTGHICRATPDPAADTAAATRVLAR